MNKIQNLKDYIFISRYSKQNGNTKESYKEAVTRVMGMHREFLIDRIAQEHQEKFDHVFDQVYDAYYDQKILGAQRSLQFGGESLLKHHMRMYNCTASYVDRVDFFHELMYIGLCGAGAGYSIHPEHVNKLPRVIGPKSTGDYVFKVPDSIEGWAEAVEKVTYAFFLGKTLPQFDYSGVRKKGAPITGGFKAPGPEPLKKCIEELIKILSDATGRQIRPFEAHLISCTIADAVISGGVRRAALLCMFDPITDKETLHCKTGDLVQRYPQLYRSNNSAIILPDTPYDIYKEVYDAGKVYGEPGFAFVESIYHVYNPCFEVGMLPTLVPGDPTKSGWSVCNLTEINGGLIKDKHDFYQAAQRAAWLGTMQAAYTDFPYLGPITEGIIRRDALIGVGITGMANNPDVLFDPDNQQYAANIVKEANKEVASILGINPAARTTVVKPSGNSSQMLGVFSGIHAGHSKRYIRNVQGTMEEPAVQIYNEVNPLAVEPMAGKEEEGHVVLSFPIEYSNDVLVKEDITAKEFLYMVKSTQANWINEGTNLDHPSYDIPEAKGLTHNVSNTISRSVNEQDLIEEELWNNRRYFTGISFLNSESGDLDYKQSPYIEVLDELELAETYGAAAILAGGLNVDGMNIFGNLYDACDTAIYWNMHISEAHHKMYTQDLEITQDKVFDLIKNGLEKTGDSLTFKYKKSGLVLTDVNSIIAILDEDKDAKMDWVRRFKKFADRYLSGDIYKTAECLKRVSAFHKWNMLKMTRPIAWETYEWETSEIDAGSQMGTACSGGKCEV